MRATHVLATALSGAAATNLTARQQQPFPSANPYDFSWIRNWAAVGDSFVAGIGAGDIWSDSDDSYACSRYDQSYPGQLFDLFPRGANFKYLACSGDRTSDVYQQINQLPFDSQDLMIVGGGGNDLCLSSLIQTCILSFQTTLAACNALQQKAQDYIDSTLQSNIEQLLHNAASRMTRTGIIVYPQYAQYFDATADNPCHFKEDWVFPGSASAGSLALTTSLRANLNKLVVNTNAKIVSAVAAVQHRYPDQIIVTAAWDGWLDVVPGARFCNPTETPDPTDPANKNAHFMKLNTSPAGYTPGTGRRSLDSVDNVTAIEMQEQSPYVSPDPELAMRGLLQHVAPLQSRDAATLPGGGPVIHDPAPGACPKSGFGLPDSIGKIFHPTVLGHTTIASFVSAAIIEARAKQLNVVNPFCLAKNQFTCNKYGDYPIPYSNPIPLYALVSPFCKDAAAFKSDGTSGYTYMRKYLNNTPDEVEFSAQVVHSGGFIDEDACISSLTRILDGCGGNDPYNPMNWKFGGQWATYSYEYSISPQKQRVWPFLKEPVATCSDSWLVLFAGWDIKGGGWQDFGYGKGSDYHDDPNNPGGLGGGIYGCMTKCTGSWPSNWHFEYYDQPTIEGYEWHAYGRSPIGVNRRCLRPCIHNAGGPTVSCSGSDV